MEMQTLYYLPVDPDTDFDASAASFKIDAQDFALVHSFSLDYQKSDQATVADPDLCY